MLKCLKLGRKGKGTSWEGRRERDMLCLSVNPKLDLIACALELWRHYCHVPYGKLLTEKKWPQKWIGVLTLVAVARVHFRLSSVLTKFNSCGCFTGDGGTIGFAAEHFPEPYRTEA